MHCKELWVLWFFDINTVDIQMGVFLCYVYFLIYLQNEVFWLTGWPTRPWWKLLIPSVHHLGFLEPEVTIVGWEGGARDTLLHLHPDEIWLRTWILHLITVLEKMCFFMLHHWIQVVTVAPSRDQSLHFVSRIQWWKVSTYKCCWVLRYLYFT